MLQSPEEQCVFGTKSTRFKMGNMTGDLSPDFQLCLVFQHFSALTFVHLYNNKTDIICKFDGKEAKGLGE